MVLTEKFLFTTGSERFDGTIAADRKLFISMVDGSVVCMEGK